MIYPACKELKDYVNMTSFWWFTSVFWSNILKCLACQYYIDSYIDYIDLKYHILRYINCITYYQGGLYTRKWLIRAKRKCFFGIYGPRKTGPWGYTTFFMLNSAEHEIFSAHKYENANYCWNFHIYWQRKFHAQLYLARKNLQLLIIWDLLAGQISCSDELSMKKVL